MATKTFEELKQLAIQIRDEKTNKQNTATRVGTAMLEHINKLEQDYYDKTTINNRTSEYNVSINHPTSGISSSNKYDLSSAIVQVPAELRTSGLTVSFLNESGDTEKWEFAGGSWAVGSFEQVGAGKLSEVVGTTVLSSNNLLLYQGRIYLGGNLKENLPNTDIKNRCYVPLFRTQKIRLVVPSEFRVNMIYGDSGCNAIGEIIYDVEEINTENPYGLITVARKDDADFTPDDVHIEILNAALSSEVSANAKTINQTVLDVDINATNIENLSKEVGMLTWDKQGTSVRTTDGEFIEAENRRRTLFNKIIDVNIITFPESSQFYIVYYDDSKKWISSDGWKNENTYSLSDNKPENAVFYVILINTETTNYQEIYIDKNVNTIIDDLQSKVENNASAVKLIQENIGNNGKTAYQVSWEKNSINSLDGSDGTTSSYEETRRRTLGFIPIDVGLIEFAKEIGEVYQIMFYDESNTFIETYPGTYTFSSELSVNISEIKPSNASFYRMCIKYPDVDTSDVNFFSLEKSGLFEDVENLKNRVLLLESSSKNKNILIVDAKGNGDYETIEEALNNANDTNENHVIIYVMPGVYYPAPKIGENVPYKENNRNVSIVGLDRNSCILKGDVGYYYYQIIVDYALIRLNGNITIANLTFDNRSDKYTETAQENGWDLSMPHCRAYCIHVDGERQAGSIMEIRNCRMYNDHFTCVGFGTRVDSTLKIVECDIKSDVNAEKNNLSGFENYGTLYGHLATNSTQPNQNLEIVRCRIENTNYETAVNLMDAAGEGAEGNVVLIQNVCATTNNQNAYKTVSKFILNKLSFGNNIEKMNSL